MFSFDQIDEYQLEITSYCNAACPQCPRNNNGSGINPYMPLRHLDTGVIISTFDRDLCLRLRQIFLCGSYGDPIMHPGVLDILADLRDKNPQLWLYMHTNGGVHDPGWWRELAAILGTQGRVDFGIDGLGDTLSVYRRNVRYDTVMRNAQAFIDAGGRAQWNFIVFEHNQHEISAARQLSDGMGFEDILFRSTGRFWNQRDMLPIDSWPVRDNQGSTVAVLRPTTLVEYQNRSIRGAGAVAQDLNEWREHFDTTKIRCDAAQGRKVAINCEGLVLPCNFFNHNLYDARFYEPDRSPYANAHANIMGKNQVREFLESYGLETLNIHHRSLREIFASPMWKDLESSWQRGLGDGRLFECAFTCGERFHKTWDQNVQSSV
jgi:MoaA/NifB/PqqE/SkfB family radical SAM enzyme